MKILIFEDEQYNFDLLRDMLQEIVPNCEIIGPLTSIAEGRRFFAERSLSGSFDGIIIADIQLNDGLSFYALADAPDDVPIIFTTAYDEYALEAFEFNSLSYLLKPIDEDELRIAIRKTQERLITDENRSILFQQLTKNANYRQRIISRSYTGEKVINVFDVSYFVSEQKSTFAVLYDGTSHLLDISLSELITQLNPHNFIRPSRKYIVPINNIDRFEQDINGKERLILKENSGVVITVSREKKQMVHKSLMSITK